MNTDDEEDNVNPSSSTFTPDFWNNVSVGIPDVKMLTENSTFNFDTTKIKSPLDAFKLFIDNEAIDIMVHETNNFAMQSLENVKSYAKSRLKSWTDTYRNEFMKLFSIILAMGLNELPCINYYWSKEPIFKNEFISTIMTRDRFLLLLRCFHFCNNNDNNLDKSDRLYKIRKVLELINKRFQTVLTPGKKLVIDESMIPFRGRLSFPLYIPNKKHKYGIKIYKLCTVDGYTINTIIYTGKNEKRVGQCHSEAIVINL